MQVACEITSADEIVVTELIFDGVLKSYGPEMLVAAMSCFIPIERSSSKKASSNRIKADFDAVLSQVAMSVLI